MVSTGKLSEKIFRSVRSELVGWRWQFFAVFLTLIGGFAWNVVAMADETVIPDEWRRALAGDSSEFAEIGAGGLGKEAAQPPDRHIRSLAVLTINSKPRFVDFSAISANSLAILRRLTPVQLCNLHDASQSLDLTEWATGHVKLPHHAGSNLRLAMAAAGVDAALVIAGENTRVGEWTLYVAPSSIGPGAPSSAGTTDAPVRLYRSQAASRLDAKSVGAFLSKALAYDGVVRAVAGDMILVETADLRGKKSVPGVLVQHSSAELQVTRKDRDAMALVRLVEGGRQLSVFHLVAADAAVVVPRGTKLILDTVH